MLGLFGLQAGFDEIDQDAARGRVANIRKSANPLGDARRQGDTLAHGLLRFGISNGLVDASHDFILRQFCESEAVGSTSDVQE